MIVYIYILAVEVDRRQVINKTGCSASIVPAVIVNIVSPQQWSGKRPLASQTV
jgi:hypothetical protein